MPSLTAEITTICSLPVFPPNSYPTDQRTQTISMQFGSNVVQQTEKYTATEAKIASCGTYGLTCGRNGADAQSRWPAPSQPGRTAPCPQVNGPRTY